VSRRRPTAAAALFSSRASPAWWPVSMAAGEYLSVRSQADAENADLKLERSELATNDKSEHRELAAIYVDRGLDPAWQNRLPMN